MGSGMHRIGLKYGFFSAGLVSSPFLPRSFMRGLVFAL